MDQLAVQTWIALILYFSMAVASLFYGPKNQRTMTFIIYVITGMFIAYVTERLAKNGYVMTSWLVALIPLVSSLIITIIATGTALGIMMVKEAPKGGSSLY